MYKNSLLSALAILLFVLTTFGQKPDDKGPKFDIVDFNKKFKVAEWLVEYDTVAWKTSDVVMAEDKAKVARLGREWFCFQDKKNIWHAVYGKLENKKYDLVFHFTMDANAKITASDEKLDEEMLRSYATALQTTNKSLQSKIPEGSPVHNQYVKRNTDQTFNVWLLPAFQTNGMAVYGGEFIYTVDKTGEKITKDESYFQGQFRGFQTGKPREIWLNFREQEKPSLGAIFFVWYYKDYFTKIFIDNAVSTSTLVGNNKDGYNWLHVEKDKEPAAKP